MASRKTDPFQEEPFRSFFEEMPSPLCRYDQTGKIVQCNHHFEQLFGLPHDKIEGRDFFEIVSREAVSPRLKKVLSAVFDGEGMKGVTWKTRRRQGKFRHFSLSTFPILNAAQKPCFGAALLLDVTQKKALEQALVQTEKMASLGTLATGLAHEVGTPMNVILGRAETLLRRTQEEKTSKGLTIIIEQIDRMTHLIERLLAFARRKPIVREQIQINGLIQKGIEIVEQRAAERGIDFVTKLTPALPVIWGDAEQMLQVVVNLLMNAVDAMYEGGEIRINTLVSLPPRKSRSKTRSRPLKNRKVEIVIKDAGSGIDAAHQPKIFDPFFTTKPVGKGTGLGLAVVHGIIREHGGEIEVESAVGQGTVFYLRLPAGPLNRRKVPSNKT
ncbi:MAG: nitrogen regulation protein NR(II) [Nitrospiria bacterium]